MSLRSDMENHPEKYPSLTLKKAQKGRWHVTFLNRKGASSPDSSAKPAPKSTNPTDPDSTE